MSLDNGIYVLQTADGFRVRYAHAIENIYSHWNNGWNKEGVIEIFGDAPVFKSLTCAITQAELIQSASPATEYGICIIDDFSHEEFPNANT